MFSDAITDVFESIFIKKVDSVGDSIDSPDGCNVKRYGVYNGNYGIYKNRLHPLSTDVESEVAVYKLAKRLGIPCCEAVQTDKNTIFSKFEYEFAKEQIVHFGRFFEDGERASDNELVNIIKKRPEYREDFYRMMFLDFITRQDDRHSSNFAVKISHETKKKLFIRYMITEGVCSIRITKKQSQTIGRILQYTALLLVRSGLTMTI